MENKCLACYSVQKTIDSNTKTSIDTERKTSMQYVCVDCAAFIGFDRTYVHCDSCREKLAAKWGSEEAAPTKEAVDRKESADSTQAGGNHYKDMAVQPWHLMEAMLTPEEFRGYLKGNLIKYAMRQGKKDSPDAEKYHHYKQKLAEIVAAQKAT